VFGHLVLNEFTWLVTACTPCWTEFAASSQLHCPRPTTGKTYRTRHRRRTTGRHMQGS
jgi:hypothetical protein